MLYTQFVTILHIITWSIDTDIDPSCFISEYGKKNHTLGILSFIYSVCVKVANKGLSSIEPEEGNTGPFRLVVYSCVTLIHAAKMFFSEINFI